LFRGYSIKLNKKEINRKYFAKFSVKNKNPTDLKKPVGLYDFFIKRLTNS